jgi:hypothetical protein
MYSPHLYQDFLRGLPADFFLPDCPELFFFGPGLDAADFFVADFREAVFLDADLRGADFFAADLRGADFFVVDFFGPGLEELLLEVDFLGADFFVDDFEDADFFFGALAPSALASESPIAIACFLLVTFLPDRPLFKVPCLRSCIALSTLS